jgi:hypothetical protein
VLLGAEAVVPYLDTLIDITPRRFAVIMCVTVAAATEYTQHEVNRLALENGPPACRRQGERGCRRPKPLPPQCCCSC